MHRNFSILQKFHETYFSSISYWSIQSIVVHLNSSFGVEKDAFFNQFNGALVELTVEQGVLSAVVNV
jgi:hypothetical protein